jgi:sugar phosphate isomerase/epimerase
VLSRRQFLGVLAASCAAGDSLGLTPGIHIRSDGRDLRSTLRDVAAIGFKEVEIAGWHDVRPTELRKLFDEAGVTCRSAHWTLWENDADSQATIDAAVELGLEYLVTPLPSLMGKEWFEANETPAGRDAVSRKMQLNDWRWNADWFNHVGGLCQKNNVQFAYLNHDFDFRKLGIGVALDELLIRTDPTRVKVEFDAGGAAAGGYDPVAFLRKHGDRVSMLHISATPGKAVAPGAVDWPAVFTAANAAGVRRYFLNVDSSQTRESFEYLRRL